MIRHVEPQPMSLILPGMSTHCCGEVIELRRAGFARYNRKPTDEFDRAGRSSHLMAFVSDGEKEVLVAAARVTLGNAFTSPLRKSLGKEPGMERRKGELPWGSRIAEFTFAVTHPDFRRRGLFNLLRAKAVVHAKKLGCDSLTLLVQRNIPADQDCEGGYPDVNFDPAPSLLRLGFREVVSRQPLVVVDASRPLQMRAFLHDLTRENVRAALRVEREVLERLRAMPYHFSPDVWHGPYLLSSHG